MDNADIIPRQGGVATLTLVGVMRIWRSVTGSTLIVTSMVENHLVPSTGKVAEVALAVVVILRQYILMTGGAVTITVMVGRVLPILCVLVAVNARASVVIHGRIRGMAVFARLVAVVGEGDHFPGGSVIVAAQTWSSIVLRKNFRGVGDFFGYGDGDV